MVAECRYIIRVKTVKKGREYFKPKVGVGPKIKENVEITRNLATAAVFPNHSIKELSKQQRKTGAGLWSQKQRFCNMVLYVV